MADGRGPLPPSDPVATGDLLKLMAWLSPAFPVGAFAYSHGLESAIADGLVRSRADASGWIAALLRRGSGWNDLVLFAEAHRAVSRGDAAALGEVAELGAALAGSAERRIETLDLGLAFAAAAEPWSGGDDRSDIGAAFDPAGGEGGLPYPVAIGALAARHALLLEPALAAFAQAFAANLLGAAVRLVPLGQRDAVAALHALEPLVTHAARAAASSSLDDLGSAAILSEIAAMRHETLSTRLFRT
ncbi:urease accessory protein UreF [Aureimonas pseudogalii]|uniref:Urease accessory protein UreF n=1 Tax=Aureimonas pseudogalii TaxID=1744844 RepID=A0A7W6H4N1_9HYPH|nr:urease accessory UreF family protein [Aureimonas pseudogalii]MBB3997369.1 urease accessory protein [Aureimonas pseudogalii]